MFYQFLPWSSIFSISFGHGAQLLLLLLLLAWLDLLNFFTDSSKKTPAGQHTNVSR